MGGKRMRRGVASAAAVSLIGTAVAAQVAGVAVSSAASHASASATTTTTLASHPTSSTITSTSIPTTTTQPGTAPTQNPASDAMVPSFGPGTSFALGQAWMLTALSDRGARLSELAGMISSSKTLQGSDSASLSALVSSAQSTCSQLQSAVNADTTLVQLRLAATEMIGSLHVYAILTPQVELTVDADAIGDAAAKLEALEPGLNTAIAAAHATKRNLARLHDLEQSFAAEASAAAALVAPLSGQLVGLSDADLAAATPVLAAATGIEPRAERDVGEAGTDLRRLLSLLANAGIQSHLKYKLRHLAALGAKSHSLIADLHI